MRLVLGIALLVTLTACVSVPPDDSSGFGKLDSGVSGSEIPPDETITLGAVISEETVETTEGTTATVPLNTNNPDISDTQDFEATKERESIESDAERLKAQRDQFTVIEPTALPKRSGGGVNIAEYALSATNAVGERKYARGPFAGAAFKRACAKYRTADAAQEAFLRAGGPRRDPGKLDPDGDGFACAWTPASYRNLLN